MPLSAWKSWNQKTFTRIMRLLTGGPRYSTWKCPWNNNKRSRNYLEVLTKDLITWPSIPNPDLQPLIMCCWWSLCSSISISRSLWTVSSSFEKKWTPIFLLGNTTSCSSFSISAFLLLISSQSTDAYHDYWSPKFVVYTPWARHSPCYFLQHLEDPANTFSSFSKLMNSPLKQLKKMPA